MKKIIRDVTCVNDLTKEYILEISKNAAKIYTDLRHRKKDWSNRLSGDSCVLLFNQESTRTFDSFNRAFRILGCTDLPGHRSAKESSLAKGESLFHTIDTYVGQGRGAKFIVIRDPLEGSAKWARRSAFRAYGKRIRRYAKTEFCFPHNLILPIIFSGGDGSHSHPSQLILDAATIDYQIGKVMGINFGECNDLGGSRVVSSHIDAAGMLEWKMHLCPFDDSSAQLSDRQRFSFVKQGIKNFQYDSVRDMLKALDILYVSRYQYNLRGEKTGGHAKGIFSGSHPQITLDLVKPYELCVLHARPIDKNAKEIAADLYDHDLDISEIQSDFGAFARIAMINYALDNALFDLESITRSIDPSDFEFKKTDISGSEPKHIHDERYTTSRFAGKGYVIDHIPLGCGGTIHHMIQKIYPDIQVVLSSNVKGDNPHSMPKDQVKLHIPDSVNFEWSGQLDSLVALFSDYTAAKSCRVSGFLRDRRTDKWTYRMKQGQDECINSRCITRPEYKEGVSFRHRQEDVMGHKIDVCPYCETPQPSEDLDSLLAR